MSKKLIRLAAERASRRIILRRSLPPDLGGGRIFASTGVVGLRCWRRSTERWDPQLLALARELVRPGSSAWDVGANAGLFTFAAASIAGPTGFCLAVEPESLAVRLLERSREAQQEKAAPTSIFPLPLGREPGQAELVIARRAGASNHLKGYGHNQAGGQRAVRKTAMVSLDWLAGVFRQPDVLKIDVEGAEAEVLSGGLALLRQARPAIICEVSSSNAAGVTDLLQGLGYSLFDGDTPINQRQPVNLARWNTLALHP